MMTETREDRSTTGQDRATGSAGREGEGGDLQLHQRIACCSRLDDVDALRSSRSANAERETTGERRRRRGRREHNTTLEQRGKRFGPNGCRIHEERRVGTREKCILFFLSLFRLQRRTERGFAAAACAAVGDPFLEHRALTHSPCACVQHPHLSLLRESKEENERRRAARHQAQGKPSRRRGRVI